MVWIKRKCERNVVLRFYRKYSNMKNTMCVYFDTEETFLEIARLPTYVYTYSISLFSLSSLISFSRYGLQLLEFSYSYPYPLRRFNSL